MLLEKTVHSEECIGDDGKTLGICLVFLAPIIVTGKMSLHATVQRNITYDEHVNYDIQLHSSID